MIADLRALILFFGGLFKSRRRLEAEKLLLRHQFNAALRRAQPRLRLRNGDRLFFILRTRLWPSLLGVVPTVNFDRLFAFLALGHDRRQLLWIEVTRHPTPSWLAQQLTEAFPDATAWAESNI